MESLESALALLMDRVYPVERTEYAPLQALLGRVAAEDVAAPIQVPPFDRSPLDGYALRGTIPYGCRSSARLARAAGKSLLQARDRPCVS